MCVLFLPETFVWNVSQSKKNSARYYKRTGACMYSTRYSCQIWTNLEFSRQIFQKSSNRRTKFHKNPSSGSRRFTCGRTDRQTDGQTDRL